MLLPLPPTRFDQLHFAPAVSAPSNGQVIRWNSALSRWEPLTIAIGLSLPSLFAVSGSPANPGGTLTATLANQTQNSIFAAPDGLTGTPAFRGLVPNDLPAGLIYANAPVDLYPTLGGTGGQQFALEVTPEIIQSGSAGYTGLIVNPTEATLGSGPKTLLDLQVGGASKCSVDHAGSITHGALTLTDSGSYPSGPSIYYYSPLQETAIIAGAGGLTINNQSNTAVYFSVTPTQATIEPNAQFNGLVGINQAPETGVACAITGTLLLQGSAGGFQYNARSGVGSAIYYNPSGVDIRLYSAGDQHIWSFNGNYTCTGTAAAAGLRTTGTTLIGASNAAYASASMSNGQINLWLDETNNALKFQCKYSSGAVKNGSIPLA